MKNKKKLKDVGIERDGRTFIIAEAGINHNGSLSLAFKLVDAAKKSGASAIKFQTYITEKRVVKNSPIFGILKQCEFSNADQKKIKEYADKKGIIFFSTPFDKESVDFLAGIDVPLFKIASFDVVNHVLLDAIARTGIPIIMSRGIASGREIDDAVAVFDRQRSEYALLHCVSAYPTPKEETNLRAVSTLRQKYDCPIGYSDHTLDIDACLYAVAHGATILEKHFTLDKKMEGPDHALSADPEQFKELVRRVRELEIMLGVGALKPRDIEQGTKIYRRVSKLSSKK